MVFPYPMHPILVYLRQATCFLQAKLHEVRVDVDGLSLQEKANFPAWKLT